MAEQQVQEAEVRFGQALDKTLREGPQVETRHGEGIAPPERARRRRRQPPIWRLLGLLGVALTCSACLCWFVPCDRGYYVAGRVLSSNGLPLDDAQVSMSWDLEPTATDAAGCFTLRGLFASPRFELTVERPSFKPVRSTRRMGQYAVDVILASADSEAPSRMVFREIPAGAPRPACSDPSR